MRNKEQRNNVYNAWMNLRFFEPKLKSVNNAIIKNDIELISFFGKDDAVIKKDIFEKCKRAFPGGQHNLINANHNFMNKEFFTLLAKELQK